MKVSPVTCGVCNFNHKTFASAGTLVAEDQNWYEGLSYYDWYSVQ